MRFDWPTLALQTVNVLVLLWLLRRFLFRPVADIIARRQEAAERLLADAAAERTRAEMEAAEIRRQKENLAADGAHLLDAARAAAETERAGILAQARTEADEARAAAAIRLERDRGRMRHELEAEARSLAVAIAGRLLGRLPAEAVDAALLQSLEARLAALSPEERKVLAQPGAPLDVITAAPLDGGRQAVWVDMLRRCLDCTPALHFVADPALIAGAELQGQHGRLRNSWQADLNRIAAELSRDDEQHALA